MNKKRREFIQKTGIIAASTAFTPNILLSATKAEKEKLADVFLGFTCPIYYGCNNINDFFGKDALVKIDINNLEESLEIIDRTINQTNLINIEEIIKARRSILLDFNMLSIISLAINHYEKSSENS